MGLHKGETRGTVPITAVNLNGDFQHVTNIDDRESEKQLIISAIDWLWASTKPIIGKNLIWDLDFLHVRAKHYFKLHFDVVAWLRNHRHLDVEVTAVALNGCFKGYPKWIDREDKPPSAQAAEMAKNGEWHKLYEYSMNEKTDVLSHWEKAGKILREGWNR